MRNLRKVTVVAVLGVFILGAVFSSSLVGCKKEDKTMGPTNDGRVSDIAIPAIDAAEPMRTETATFALG
jgi:hypothetical protein